MLKLKNNRQQQGFTIVELIVIIVVIGILATVTIVVYSGTRSQAHATSLKSDLSNNSKILEIAGVRQGRYPADKESANGGQGLVVTKGNILNYNTDAQGSKYCLQAVGNGLTYFMTSNSSYPEAGVCSGSDGLAGSDQYTQPENQGIVTTLAGSSSGFADGVGASAQFFVPNQMAMDSKGALYVVDERNHRIRKITKSGAVTTLAGSSQGYTDGSISSALFTQPRGVAVDSSDNVYISENHRIRKITPAGVVSTFAGGSTAGTTDGNGTSARFNMPTGLSADQAGNVYVADFGNNRIRKITPAGVVSTLAGSTEGYVNGNGSSAQFDAPFAVVANDDGSILYVADTYNSVIRKITASGDVTTYAGSTYGYADGSASVAKFNNPQGITLDTYGNLYISDTYNSRIRKVTSAGVVSTLAGSSYGYADGTGASARFYGPNGIAVDQFGVVYVADTYNQRIRVIR